MNELVYFVVFFLPAYAANMAPVFVRNVPLLAMPIDGGRTWRGKRLLGGNKTVRGLVFGTLVGGAAGALVEAAGVPFVWWWGFVLGLAALVGDALKSVVKRQLGIRPGGRFMPFDQLDFIIVAYLVSLCFVRFSWQATLGGFAIIFGGTVLVQLIGGWTRLKADSL